MNIKRTDFSYKSDIMYIMKALAVISVITAHCSSVMASANQFSYMISAFCSSIGTIGVGIFFFISGYFFCATKKTFLNFFVSKIKTIIIPWIFCGTIVYLYVHLRKGGISVVSLFKWLIGQQTYLYYLTVLIILYALFFYLRRFNWALCITVILSVVSISFTQFGIIKVGNPFLNPFNFMIWFALGVLIAKFDLLDILFTFSKTYKFLALIAYLICIILFAVYNKSITYFSLIYIPLQIFATVWVIGLSQTIFEGAKKLVIDIGKNSYAIYLLHMPFAGIVAFIFNNFLANGGGILIIFRPIITVAITYLFMWIASFVAEKIRLSALLKTLTAINMLNRKEKEK